MSYKGHSGFNFNSFSSMNLYEQRMATRRVTLHNSAKLFPFFFRIFETVNLSIFLSNVLKQYFTLLYWIRLAKFDDFNFFISSYFSSISFREKNNWHYIFWWCYQSNFDRIISIWFLNSCDSEIKELRN